VHQCGCIVTKQYPPTTLSLSPFASAGLTSLSAIELCPPSARQAPTTPAAAPPAQRQAPLEGDRGFPFWAVWIALAAVGLCFYMPVVNVLLGEAAATLCGR
jgi:hypothetical protein